MEQRMRYYDRIQAARGALFLVTVCAIPLALWAGSAPLDSRFTGSYATLTSVAVACALAGTAAFALNLVLGARIRLVEALFGGLDRMYRAHRLNGQAAFTLLLGHVVLILAGRATISSDVALDLLGPGAGWTVFAGVLAFAAMTVAIVLTLFVRLGHEVFVYVQRTFGFVFLVATYHVFTTSGARDDSAALNVYMALLATLGVAAFVYRSLLGNLLVRRRRYRVAAVNRLDGLVTEIVMEPLGRPLSYAAGQFVFVNFRSLALGRQLHPFELSVERQVFSIRAGDVRNQFHPFSITSAPGEPELRVTVKAVGDYTRALRRLEVGAEAVVEGPYGSFSHADVPGRRQIWIAGGIGVTPFLSMARGLGDDERPDVDFYYCVERAEEAHFLEELRSLVPVTLVARDVDGFLTAERLAVAHPDLSHAEVLVCGPPAMIASLRAQLAARGVPRQRFHAEEFGFAKIGRPRPAEAAESLPSALAADRKLLASLAAVAFAGPTLAIGVLVGAYLLARGR
ncbi:MAG: ferredoxin reductase family protein [Gaiellaceae bacterium]